LSSGEAENAILVQAKFVIAFPVIYLRLCVNRAVDLDDETVFSAEKVRNEPAHGNLSAEFQAGTPPVTQGFPENRFCFCHPMT
jgi:hypothetical protein